VGGYRKVKKDRKEEGLVDGRSSQWDKKERKALHSTAGRDFVVI
jgi:hypothetical protein